MRWPLAFALVAATIGYIFAFGSVTAATMWLLVSVAFRLYVSHFADYQKTYGAIGGGGTRLLGD